MTELNPRALFWGFFLSFSSGCIKEQTLIMFILNTILRAKIAGERERERERERFQSNKAMKAVPVMFHQFAATP